MIEDMTVRRSTAKTQSDYIRSVRNLAVFLGRSPNTATAEDLRRFQLHLTETRIRPPTVGGTVLALRFFFTVTLGRADRPCHRTRPDCKSVPLKSRGG
jgi:integrase/recombinase XerD